MPLAATSHRRTRTFTGCLTCRRRKVKCPDVTIPCGACSRLKLECVAPIFKNLRSFTAKTDQRTGKSSSNYSTASRSVITNALSTIGPDIDSRASYSHTPTTGQQDEIPAISNEVALIQWSHIDSQNFSITQPGWLGDHGVFDVGNHGISPPSQWPADIFPLHHSGSPSPTQVPFSTPWLNTFQGSSAEMHSTTLPLRPQSAERLLSRGGSNRPPQVPSFPATPITDEETLILRHFIWHMIPSLSVKDSRWNIFTFLFGQPDRITYSPLRSSIVAMAAAHLCAQHNTVMSEVALEHYSLASNMVVSLINDLSLPAPLLAQRAQPTAIRTLLAASFFLSHCDFMTTKLAKYIMRIGKLKDLINSQWKILVKGMSSIDYRLLFWLAYLDVRFAAFTPLGRGGDPIANATLLTVVLQNEDLFTLCYRSRLYLSDGFGDNYPNEELHGDMVQDAVNAKLAETMSLLNEVIMLSKSSQNTPQPYDIDQKTEKLFVRLYELQQECDRALKKFVHEGRVCASRASFHWLNLKAVGCSAIILLNRFLNPTVRTDQESQKAARQILQITLRLRDGRKLHNPHSMLSSFAVFVAGIEIDDDIYRDWTLSLLKSFKTWGAQVRGVIYLLRQVMKIQDERGCRVDIRELSLRQEPRVVEYILQAKSS